MADGKGKSNHYSPVKQQNSGGFKNFLWNPDTGEFLGRTGSSWFKITVFYIFFFAGLAAFFGLMLYIFLLTLNPNHPKWIGEDGLIGKNPGIGFRPMPDQEKNVESTLIWFDRNKEKKDPFWSKELDDFFDKNYKNRTGSAGTAGEICKFGKPEAGGRGWIDGVSAQSDKACNLDKSTMLSIHCSSENNAFGYGDGDGKPCVLIKLNKIYDWKPDPYKTEADLEEATKKNMPEYMQKRIRDLINQNLTGHSNTELDTVWVTCEGENPADRENIGPVEYYASGITDRQFPGIPGYFFPYSKQDNYKAPFVFVKFTKPQTNVLIQIECKAWDKKISPDRQQRLGSVHFELMID